MTTPKIIEDGDIFRSRAQTLVNTVNCVGVMGKGIALGFKRRFPEMYDDYVARCERGEVKLGRPYLYRYAEGPWILNFPTKDHWRGRSQLAAIETGLRFLASNYKGWGISSLAVPPLGAGNGGLEWHVVGPTLFRHLNEMDIPIELYVPYGTPHAELQPEFAQTSLTERPELVFDRIGPDWVALLVALERLERQPYRPRVGRTLFQKLAYFGSQAGLNLDLGYGRASYGPFSPDLKSAITHLENNGLIAEEKRGRMFVIRLGSTFASAEHAMEQALAPYEPMIDKLVDLFARIRTAPEAEVAASVHFAWSELERSGREPTEEAIVQAVMEWKARRQPELDSEVVAQATRDLNLLGWIRAQPSKSLVSAVPDLAAPRT